MAAFSISDARTIHTSCDEAPEFHYPAQVMAGSCQQGSTTPTQSIKSSPASPPTEVEVLADGLKRLQSLIEKYTQTQEDEFREIKSRLDANFSLANQGIKLAHESNQKAESTLDLVKAIRNDTKGLGEVDSSDRTLLARLRDLLLGVHSPVVTADSEP
ncbi:hypothetical protein P692DRAFT_20880298 [Suillus brevipes Sb2]|nr:hypothetical protein P692DRAFT_20880298 [Suillus brevipes Sb2]